MLQKHLFMHQETLGEEGNMVSEGHNGGECEEAGIHSGNWKFEKN